MKTSFVFQKENPDDCVGDMVKFQKKGEEVSIRVVKKKEKKKKGISLPYKAEFTGPAHCMGGAGDS